MGFLRYVKAAWPDGDAPPGEPLWFFYEIDDAADSVLRSVRVYSDGPVTRNSVELEERTGMISASLIDCSVAHGFKSVDCQPISREEFSKLWKRGVDTPFWNVS